MKQKFLQLSESVYHYVVECYRHLHAHPELSFQEFDTSAFIRDQLKSMEISCRCGYGNTGILGIIKGRNPDKITVALRADMDALPIHEETDLPWKSVNPNVMHACGHDAHTACLLGAARILNELKNEFEGTVLLVFQPGEEKAPGGASLMLKDGVFKDFKPDLIIGQHVSEDYPTGSLSFRNGTVMASADEIHLTIKGKGGHGAKPHLCNDTVLAAAQTLVSLQQVRSRLCPPLTPMVLTFGKFAAEGATNVIPDEVKLAGTFRTFDEHWRLEAKNHIKRIIHDTCSVYGCTAEIDMPDGYPCLVNNDEITRKSGQFAVSLLGEDKILEYDQRLTSEDFSFFSQQYPACFYRFGIRGESNINAGRSHTSGFCIDEKSLLTGMSGMAWIALGFLNEPVIQG